MTPEITIDYSVWNQAANQFVQRLGYSAQQVLREQGSLLALQLMHNTPPFVRWNSPSPKADYAIGAASIDRNLKIRAMPLQLVKWETNKLAALYRRTAGNLDALQKWIPKVFKGWRVVRFTPELHKVNGGLDRRGRARVSRTFVTGIEDWLAHREKLQARIGYAKAGWAKASEDLGRDLQVGRKRNQVPPYVARHVHGYAPGGGVDKTNQPNPEVRIGNWSKSIQYYGQKMKDSMIRRAEMMYKDLFQQLEKAAAQAGFSRHSTFSNYAYTPGTNGGKGSWRLTN